MSILTHGAFFAAILYTVSCFPSGEIKSKRGLPFTLATVPPPTLPPTPSSQGDNATSDNLNYHFRVHLSGSKYTTGGNISWIKLTNFRVTNPGSHVSGHWIDFVSGTITIPTSGFYYFRIAIKLDVVSKPHKADTITVCFCEDQESCKFETGILYHVASVTSRGVMIIETSSIVKLETDSKIRIYMNLPGHLRTLINSSTYIDGMFIKSA